jgi:hypothetical protein
MKRVFISYRSSDGKKDASRLAEDLQEIFGEQAVFYDKHDLHGGTSWREQVKQTLGNRPIVLVLLTPDYFGAKEDGELRIHRSDDPVRQELLAAFDTQATVLPLLTEGVSMPRPSALPADLGRVTEAHALRLRTEDWRADLARLVKDLQKLGVTPDDPQALARRGFYSGAIGEGLAAAGSTSGYKWLYWAAGLTLLFAAVSNQPDNDHDTRVGLAAVSLLPVWLAWRGRSLLKGLPGTAPKVWGWVALGWCVLVGIGLIGQVASPPALSGPSGSSGSSGSSGVPTGTATLILLARQ